MCCDPADPSLPLMMRLPSEGGAEGGGWGGLKEVEKEEKSGSFFFSSHSRTLQEVEIFSNFIK